MPNGTPWPLLLAHLRRSETARLSYAEVRAAKADPVVLVRERVLEPGNADAYVPQGCEHGCVPNFDVESRAKEGLVGVACPYDPPCWFGWSWVPVEEVEGLRCRARRLFSLLAEKNCLSPITGEVPPPFVPVGTLSLLGSVVPVVWLRVARSGFKELVVGLHQRLGGDGLVVLTGKVPELSFGPSSRIAVIALLDDPSGHLGLHRAYEIVVPGYRKRMLEEPSVDLDVQLTLGTNEERHLVTLNGREVPGFRNSDVMFTQLLLLAAWRREGKRDGWHKKAGLVGDFATRPESGAMERADDDLVRLRKVLRDCVAADFEKGGLNALVKADAGKGLIRLAVAPTNIALDPSLSDLEWKSVGNGKKRPAPKQVEGLAKARLLLAEARRCGAPGNPTKVPGVPVTKAQPTRGGR